MTEKYSVSPNQIDTSRHPYDSFGNRETEVSAYWIVKFFQAVGSWRPFTEQEINDFYHQWRPVTETFCFNRLIEEQIVHSITGDRRYEGGGWVVRNADGTLEVTEEFVQRMYAAVPMQPDENR